MRVLYVSWWQRVLRHRGSKLQTIIGRDNIYGRICICWHYVYQDKPCHIPSQHIQPPSGYSWKCRGFLGFHTSEYHVNRILPTPHWPAFGRGRRRYCLVNKLEHQFLYIEVSCWTRALSFGSLYNYCCSGNTGVATAGGQSCSCSTLHGLLQDL